MMKEKYLYDIDGMRSGYTNLRSRLHKDKEITKKGNFIPLDRGWSRGCVTTKFPF